MQLRQDKQFFFLYKVKNIFSHLSPSGICLCFYIWCLSPFPTLGSLWRLAIVKEKWLDLYTQEVTKCLPLSHSDPAGNTCSECAVSRNRWKEKLLHLLKCGQMHWLLQLATNKAVKIKCWSILHGSFPHANQVRDMLSDPKQYVR